MSSDEPAALMLDLRNALISAAKVVRDNFGKPVSDLGMEYKLKDGDTARTVIDRYAQDRMQGYLSSRYPKAIYNLEETDVDLTIGLEGKLLIFGDPFDGTANAQPKLPLSTQGLIAAHNGKFVAAAALHPFEKYILYGAEGVGVFRADLAVDDLGEYHLANNPAVRLPSLEGVYERLKTGKEILMPFVDAHYTPINFVAQRKAKWKELFVETLDKEYGGKFNARMMREMGSNIDACMKLAEGRLHVQLTDTIGGIYDVAVGATFLPLLGGVMTDKDGNPLQVPKVAKEMETPIQQVVIASIHPELHENIIKITQDCYSQGSLIYMPRKGLVVVPEYRGFKKWDEANKAVFDSLSK
jgi:fructose-1,6-bisphosphatase/inositol monophosphatase family enzyme